MKIIDRLREDSIHISFEVFPPKTDEGFDKVIAAVDAMAGLNMARGAVRAKIQRRSLPISKTICTC